jgi:hypothetical protein
MNEVGPDAARDCPDLTASVNRRHNHARRANRELHRRIVPPRRAQTVLQTVRQNHGTRTGKRICRVSDNECHDADLVSALFEPFDEKRETPFGSSRGVASRVNE